MSKATFARGCVPLAFLSLGLICGLPSSAAVYYSKAGTASRSPMNGCVVWCSDRACTTAVSVTPAANDGNVYVFLGSAKMNPGVFPAKAYWGCDGSLEGENKGDFSTYANKGTHQFDDCTVVSGAFSIQDGPEPAVFAGRYNLLDGKTFTFQSFGGQRNFRLGAAFVLISGPDSTVKFRLSKSSENYTSKFSIEGDLSGFKGKIVTDTIDRPQGPLVRGLLSFVSSSSFGDPTSVKADAVTLCTSNYLCVADTAVQSPTRGVKLDLKADKRAGVFADSGKRWTLTAPVTGSTGIFAKIGAGTTVLDGPFDFSAIDVEEGTLVLGANGTFKANTAVHVSSGARLVLNQEPVGLAVTCDEGGNVAYEVPYDPASGTTPLNVSAAAFADIKARYPDGIAISLSQQVALPQNDRLRLPVMVITGGTAVVGDFLDATGKTDDLPKTHFEIDTDGGVQTVNLVVHPVIDYTNATGNKSLMTEGNWTSGRLPEAGCDYRKPLNIGNGLSRTGSGSSIKEYIFGGDSLTVYGRELWNYAGDFCVPELVLRGNTGVLLSSGTSGSYRKKVMRGVIRPVNNGTTEAATLAYNMTESLDIRSVLVGYGRLKIVSQQSATVPLRASADNSAFLGRLVFGISTNSYSMNLVVTNATALGGALSAATPDGVTFDAHGEADCSRVSLTAEADIVFDAANRGWKADYMTLAASAGKTLSLDVPSFAVSGALAKGGAGTLALKTVLAGAGLSTVPVAVNGGFVRALGPTAWNAAAFTVADGAGFEVDLSTGDAALLASGVRAASISPADGTIAVRGVIAPNDDRLMIEAAICTVPSANADLTDAWRPLRIPRHSCKVRKVELTGDDAGLVTYVLRVESSGLAVVVK